MNDPLINQSSLLVSVLDQNAAKCEDAGEIAKAEASKRLAESFANVANTLRNIFQRMEKRVLNRICNEGLDSKPE